MGVLRPVKDLVSGRVFLSPSGRLCGVGLDASWVGSPLAMANLYCFERPAWNPSLSSETIINEWTRLTFGSDPLVVKRIANLQLSSWQVYESYAALGVGKLMNILGNHYDPG